MPTAEPAHTGPFSPIGPNEKPRPPATPAVAGCRLFLVGQLVRLLDFHLRRLEHPKDFLVKRASPTKETGPSKTLHYLGDSELKYYKDVATEINYTEVVEAG